MFNILTVFMSCQILSLSVQQCHREMVGAVRDFKIIIENNVSFSGQSSIVHISNLQVKTQLLMNDKGGTQKKFLVD